MGTLYIVATPIGNLEDITLRAINILKQVDMIACEDSRITKRLLKKYDITTPTISYHQHSSDKKNNQLLNYLKFDKDIALVTDAGTPGIQDPGNKFVELARNEDLKVIAIPGASAVTTALSMAGINTDSFYFAGFIPKKKGRQTWFKNAKNIDIPIVLYESPYRIVKTLKDIYEYLGNKKIFTARELTKKFEETKTDFVKELIEYYSQHKPKGEFVLIVLPKRYTKDIKDS